MVTGSIPVVSPSNSRCYFIKDGVDEGLRQFWELESTGVLQSERRYEVGLPWKRDFKDLSDNLAVARRLVHLNNDYREILNDYETQGIIEKVPNDKVESDKPLFYLPFSMVYRDSVSSKKRIVFDASAHEQGELSLNDAGLSLNPLIFNMLVFFRLNAVVVLADIEKAFFQISLHGKDRNAVRFLFPSKNPGTNEHYGIQIFRFCRVLFGVNASSYLLSATIKEHIEKFRELHPATVEMLDKCLYVDDFVGALDNVSSGFKCRVKPKGLWLTQE
ncbi:uncharacterized protein LOC118198691 [Stegodyphus dumicola]|uniref:uncharacterized protein LOC118198691 n=1 Tax=Stegodyphus dumicola TaxID=202533 RepID=UPI0015AECD66|nr:uncharacterized protein LOC118198691 [Stegodyphus dumicola]